MCINIGKQVQYYYTINIVMTSEEWSKIHYTNILNNNHNLYIVDL